MFDLPTHLPNQVSIPVVEPVTITEEEPLDEEISVKPDEPIYISGTNITLQTEEDIAKWIEDRKKKWPSRKVIAEKEQQKNQQSVKRSAGSTSTGSTSTDSNKRSKTICRFYQQNKKCKFGNKCKNLHEQANIHELTHYRRNINGYSTLIPKLYTNRTNNTLGKSSLFKHLQFQDQVSENNQIIEFIKYLDKNKLINYTLS